MTPISQPLSKQSAYCKYNIVKDREMKDSRGKRRGQNKRKPRWRKEWKSRMSRRTALGPAYMQFGEF